MQEFVKNFQQVFDNLSCGKIDPIFLGLIRPTHQQSHREHVKDIAETKEQIDYVHGALIKTCSGVYRPHPASSSMFMLRAIFSAPYDPVDRILDIGTGSGVIGIALVHTGLARYALMTDIDSLNVDVAMKNVNLNQLEAVIDVRQSDLFSTIREEEKFDKIFFNTPFWHKSKGETNELEAPLVDVDGSTIREYFLKASKFLKKDGEIWFTYSNLCNPVILEEASNFWDISLILGEYAPDIGLFKFVFKGKIK